MTLGRLAGALDASSYHPDPDARDVALIRNTIIEAARRIEARCFRPVSRAHDRDHGGG
jgi:transcriptional regulator of acetoin/glycerol metabolism